MSFENVKGFKDLTREQKALLERVYKKHMLCQWEEEKEIYKIENILEVKWDQEEKTVNIYFQDIWWHYNQDGSWY